MNYDFNVVMNMMRQLHSDPSDESHIELFADGSILYVFNIENNLEDWIAFNNVEDLENHLSEILADLLSN